MNMSTTPSGEASQSDAGNTEASAPQETAAEALEREFGSDDDGSPAPEDDDGGEHGTEQGTEPKEGDEAESNTEAEEGDDADPAEDGEEGNDDEAAEGADGDKPKSRTQQRIDDLTAKRREAEREAEYWRKKAEEGESSREADPEGTQDDEPDPEKYEFGEADDQYLRDHGKWEGRMEARQEAAQNELKSQARALDAKWEENSTKAVERYDDFNEVVIEGGKQNKWRCPPVVAVGIKDSDYGADIAYELAKDPVKADKLGSMSPLEQAREFGRMEERHASKAKAASTPTPPPAARSVSKAPTPPTNRARGGSGRFTANGDTDDFAAFERMADKSLGKK